MPKEYIIEEPLTPTHGFTQSRRTEYDLDSDQVIVVEDKLDDHDTRHADDEDDKDVVAEAVLDDHNFNRHEDDEDDEDFFLRTRAGIASPNLASIYKAKHHPCASSTHSTGNLSTSQISVSVPTLVTSRNQRYPKRKLNFETNSQSFNSSTSLTYQTPSWKARRSSLPYTAKEDEAIIRAVIGAEDVHDMSRDDFFTKLSAHELLIHRSGDGLRQRYIKKLRTKILDQKLNGTQHFSYLSPEDLEYFEDTKRRKGTSGGVVDLMQIVNVIISDCRGNRFDVEFWENFLHGLKEEHCLFGLSAHFVLSKIKSAIAPKLPLFKNYLGAEDFSKLEAYLQEQKTDQLFSPKSSGTMLKGKLSITDCRRKGSELNNMLSIESSAGLNMPDVSTVNPLGVSTPDPLRKDNVTDRRVLAAIDFVGSVYDDLGSRNLRKAKLAKGLVRMLTNLDRQYNLALSK